MTIKVASAQTTTENTINNILKTSTPKERLNAQLQLLQKVIELVHLNI